MDISIDIFLQRVNKIYHENELLSGEIVIHNREELKHEGIFATAEGTVNMQIHSRGPNIFENFYSSIKPINILNNSVTLFPPGRLPTGATKVSFEITLNSKHNKVLYETYHGYCVIIQYLIKCEVKKNLLSKNIVKSIEFFVEYLKGDKAVDNPVEFIMSPTLMNIKKDRLEIPRFSFKGRLNSTVCTICEPFTGEFLVEKCDAEIKSLVLQLFRIETCGSAESAVKEASEIQSLQFGAGNICKGVSIPIHLLFPRLMTCPTIVSSNFRIEFEVRIVVIFENDMTVHENFPINLTRF